MGFWSSWLKKIIQGVVKLAHFEEYFYTISIATLLGISAANGCLDWRFLILFPANWLAVGFAYMVNDIENAPNDALKSSMTKPNPVSLGWLSSRTARYAAFLIVIIVVILAVLLGKWPLIFLTSSLLLGFLYSYRGTLLKNIRLFDIIVHSLAFAGLQFLTGYFSYSSHFQPNWFWPFSFILSMSVLSALNQQTRNIESDRIQHQNTSKFLGKRTSQILKVIILVFCAFSAVVSLIISDIIPFWTFILGLILTCLLVFFRFSRDRKTKAKESTQEVILKSIEQAFTLALYLQFVIPWVNPLTRFFIG